MAVQVATLAVLAVSCACVHPQEVKAPAGFRLVIEAPQDLARILSANLELGRWQSYEDLTADLLEALVARARDEATEIAATEGYYSARVEARIEPGDGGRVVRLIVEPGEPVRVQSVTITFREEPGRHISARVREQWALPVGAVFRQGAWEAAKKNALELLAMERYAAAGIARSRANVDPGTASARLELELDHGPEFAFGPISIKGLAKYPRESVLNLAPFRAGEPYTREKVDTYVRRLTATGYFASAQVAMDRSPASAAAAPVEISVIEAPTRRLDAGIGFSTDARYRTSLGWRDVNLLDSGWRFQGTLQLESQSQSIGAGLELPARNDRYADLFDAVIARTDVQNLVTRGITVNATRRALDERRQPAYGLSYYREEEAPLGAAPDTARAWFARYEYVRRTLDDLVQPRSGAVAAVRLGVGLPGVSTQGFGRVVGQLAWFHPLSRRNEIAVRAEAGAVFADSARGVPQSLLFRTGGDNSVRGYAFQSLGPTRGGAIVGGRYYALTSAEYTRWLSEAWGVAAFVDAGNAVDQWSDMRLAVGYGAGVRVRTPVGPFRLDVAHGRDTDEVRLHFSVGIAF